MTYAQVIAQIEQFIITNGNNEITAAILNPILKNIAGWANDSIGDISELTTTANTNLVDAINEINQALSEVTTSGIQIYSGLDNPNDTPPPIFSTGDFYIQLDGSNNPIDLFQYTGSEWLNVKPNAQQVMDAGNTSTTPFVAENESTAEKIQYGGEGIKHQKSDITTGIKFEENTVSVEHTVPPKPANDVFAFQSDITSLQGEIGLIPVTEGSNSGYRLSGENPANHGDIGAGAVDVSISNTAGTNGATGTFSYAEGFNTKASGSASHAEGGTSIASGDYSHSEGFANTAGGIGSHAEGGGSVASGNYSHVEGNKNFSRAEGEHSGGRYGTDYTATNSETDRLLNYGNGTSEASRSDALTLYRSGVLVLPSSSIAKINAAGAKAVATTEWVYSKVYTVDVEYFGAVGDGVTDDADAIQDALNSTFSHIIIGKDPNSVYVVSRTMLIPSNKTVIINGTVIIQDGYEDLLLANASIGATTVTVTDADTKYFPGQQVCISSTAMLTQAGQTGQTRKYGEAFYVESVSGDTITLSNATHYNFTTANSAKIGHNQNVFLIQGTIAENKTKINIVGFGIIDQNKDNQYDVEPVSWNLIDEASTFAEDSRFGCGISAVYSNNIYIGDGLTVKDTVLHGVTIFNVDYIDINRLTVDGAHDKNILIYYTQDFTVTNTRVLNADYEDGIYLHNDARRGFLSNIYAENCSRRGIGIGNNSSDIVIQGAIAKDCGRAGEFINSTHCSVKSFKSIGGGKDRHLLTNRPMFTIQAMVDSDFDLQVTDSTLAQVGITVIGATTNCTLKAHVADLLSSESDGVGLAFGAASGVYPSNIFIYETFILRNKLGIRLDHSGVIGSTNIKIDGGSVKDNTVNITNNIGKEFKAFNVDGITNTHAETLFYNTTKEVSVTGTTSPTVVGYKLFPANTLSDGVIEIEMPVEHQLTTAGFVTAFYLNDTPNLSGTPVTIATFIGGSTNLYSPFARRFVLDNSTLKGWNFSNSIVRDNGSSNVAPSSTALNYGANKYIVAVAYPLNAADTVIMKNLAINFKPMV